MKSSMVFVATNPPFATNPPLVLEQFRREAAKIFRKYKSLRFWTKSGAFSTLAINPPCFGASGNKGGGLSLRIPLIAFLGDGTIDILKWNDLLQYGWDDGTIALLRWDDLCVCGWDDGTIGLTSGWNDGTILI